MNQPETFYGNVSAGADDAVVRLEDISLPLPNTTLDSKTSKPDHLASDADEQVIGQQMVDGDLEWVQYFQMAVSNATQDDSFEPINAPSKLQPMVSRKRDAEDCSLTRETSLSCIAYFEGCYNIPPAWLRDVFAISPSDSLYIDAQVSEHITNFSIGHS